MMCMGVERVKTAKMQTLKSEFKSISMKEMDSLDNFLYETERSCDQYSRVW